ncbi:NADP-dependent oxidoreductase [Streptomyces sp. NPDC029526]|uniref:NADP-dependent oxidoreductase n=1 Tax=Streptomyces sp. NPDC029526 TaxID=3155728 RepID=UPI0033FCECC9
MRAVVLTTYGGPEVLTVREVPEPDGPGPDGVLVRSAAVAVNPVDLQTRAGLHTERTPSGPPMILGWDLAGTVTAVGEAVTGFAVGDHVVAMSAQLATGRGTHAESVALPADAIAHAPSSVPLSDAAGLPLAGLTAWQALGLLALPERSSVLITGALGAVGGLAVQLARRRGLTVVAHIRSAREAEQARALGAERVVDERCLPDAGVDGLLETAGLPRAITAVRDGGRAVSIVPTRVPTPERGIEVAVSYVEQSGADLATLCALVDAGELRLRTARRLGFADAAEAHRLLAAGGVRGKLVLLP